VVAVVIAILVCLGLLAAVLADRSGEPAAMPVGGPSEAEWQLEFSEDFTGDKETLLESGVWHSGWFGDGELTEPVNSRETALMSTANLSVADGRARFDITPNVDGQELADGTTYPNLGAAINTDESQASSGFMLTYGYVEARMQLPAGSPAEDVWPSFWLNGHRNPEDMEIDVVEGDGTDQGNKFNIHYGTGEETINLNRVDRDVTVKGATTGMHTYAADVRPDGITFYYDGEAVHTYEGEVPDVPRYLMVGVSSAGTMSSTSFLIVDHVRAWTRD
jgi:beta-glucanase (GH16 family)